MQNPKPLAVTLDLTDEEREAFIRDWRKLQDGNQRDLIPSDFSVKAVAADKADLVALLERCYMFLADNSHEAEEDAAQLMGDIEAVIELNAG